MALRLRRWGKVRFVLGAPAGLCLPTARAPGGSPFALATASFELCIVGDVMIAELWTQASAGLELNLEAARRGGVSISAKLIAVSRLVAGGRD